MDLQQLRGFREVARHRSFSGAAKALFLSQPAVSRQIASLEAEIGMPLFVRMGNSISLTDPGRRLLVYVEDILLKYEQAQRTIKDLNDLRQGTVTVAADSYLSKYYVPNIIAEFYLKHPTLQVQLITSPQTNLVSMLAEGKADVAFFCGEPTERMGVALEKIDDEQLMFVSSKLVSSDIKTNTKKIAPFIFPPAMNSFGEDYIKAIPQEITRESSLIVIDSLEGIKSTLLAGLGCSILPVNLMKTELGKGLLQGISLDITCPVILTYPKDISLPHPVLLFMGIVHKVSSRR